MKNEKIAFLIIGGAALFFALGGFAIADGAAKLEAANSTIAELQADAFSRAEFNAGVNLQARESGYNLGYAQGKKTVAGEAYSNGFAKGYDVGRDGARASEDSYIAGYAQGKNVATAEAHSKGYLEGFNAGQSIMTADKSPAIPGLAFSHLLTGANVNMTLDRGGCIVGPFDVRGNLPGSIGFNIPAGASYPMGCNKPTVVTVFKPVAADIWCDNLNILHINGILPHLDNQARMTIDCVPLTDTSIIYSFGG